MQDFDMSKELLFYIHEAGRAIQTKHFDLGRKWADYVVSVLRKFALPPEVTIEVCTGSAGIKYLLQENELAEQYIMTAISIGEKTFGVDAIQTASLPGGACARHFLRPAPSTS
ncbi:MAG: hypothetical protein KKA55_07075 [Proteobacteria bacterium]|nr:hypothetical protein [Pseudomonadota bacterium]MBU1595281.1 hypothetical protein [Pseudomonadota bacterium]